jgi:hypothetical protein
MQHYTKERNNVYADTADLIIVGYALIAVMPYAAGK